MYFVRYFKWILCQKQVSLFNFFRQRMQVFYPASFVIVYFLSNAYICQGKLWVSRNCTRRKCIRVINNYIIFFKNYWKSMYLNIVNIYQCLLQCINFLKIFCENLFVVTNIKWLTCTYQSVVSERPP